MAQQEMIQEEMVIMNNILPIPFFDNIETIRQLTDKARLDLDRYLLSNNGLDEVRYDLDLIKRGAELLIQEIDNNE